MNKLLFLLTFVFESCSVISQVLADRPAKPFCTKLEDTICPLKPATFCKESANFRFQCPRKCGICVDKPVVPKHLVKVDEARLVIKEVVQDVIKSSILTGLTSNSTAKPKNLNQVNEVLYQIERSIAQADLSRKKHKIPELKNDIKEAVKLGNMKFARRAVAIALNTIGKSSSGAAGRRKRSTKINPKKFLAEVRADIGEKNFSKLLGVDGGKTLMFVIDITGSMREEIRAAKAIAIEISTYKRRNPPINYILSTFGDPVEEQSNLTFKEEGQVEEFIDEIRKLNANGGGDCPEYTFNGMIAAIEEGPEYGSPLIVFTDAPPKDTNEDNNLNYLINLAKDNEVDINFFTHETCDSFPFKSFDVFKQLSKETGGQYLPMQQYELRSLAKFTDAKLGALAEVKTGGTVAKTRRKRSTVDEILITLDDTVDRLVVSASTENSATEVTLRAPSGIPWTEGKNIMTNAAVYIVDLPVDGDWKLEIPASAGEYEYSAKVSSTENIDFKHDFKKSVNRKKLILKYPLAGEQAEVQLRMTGEKQIKKDSLRVDIVDVSGEVLIPDLKPTPNGADGVYYILRFSPPNEKFKIMLKGVTSKNKVFTRISKRADQVKPLVLKKFYNSRGDFIRPGGSVFLMLYLFNGKDSNQAFQVSFRDSLGYSVSLLGRRRLTVRAKSKKFLRVAVRYGGGKRGREGQNENVIIVVKSPDGSVASEVVPLMVKG